MEKINTTIIGAGVVGLNIAALISDDTKSVCLIEKNESFGMEISSRHSEVIHSGIYYPKNSLKKKLCIEGRELLYQFCQNQGIPHKRIGKLIVAAKEEEILSLETLYNKGKENGITDLTFLSAKEVNELEPYITAKAAIFSPSTGIVDSHKFMKVLLRKTEKNNTIIAFNTEVIGIEKAGSCYKVSTKGPDGDFSFLSKIIINSAGLNSDKIAGLIGIDIIKEGYKLNFCKGEYFWVQNEKNKFIKRLIYPVPPTKDGTLGIHTSFDLENRMKLGPSTEYIDNIDYSVNSDHKKVFFDSVKSFCPFISFDDIQPDMAGVRPRLSGKSGQFKDFVIKNENDKGFDGFINLIGIESPGLTASLAIGKYVSRMVKEILKN